MVGHKKEVHTNSCNCAKKFFYLSISFMVITLLAILILFSSAGSNFAGKAAASPSFALGSDYVKFKQLLCERGSEGSAGISTIPSSKEIPQIPSSSSPEEICNNQNDDNKNGQVDCAENSCDGKDCGSAVTLTAVCSQKKCVKKELSCHDYKDNDEDGKTDCDDLDCWEIDMVVGSSDYGKNKCWQLTDSGVIKGGKSLSGHFCSKNEDCADGYCVMKNQNLPSAGSYCAPICGESCQEVYPGIKSVCSQVGGTCPDCTFICKSPYGVKGALPSKKSYYK